MSKSLSSQRLLRLAEREERDRQQLEEATKAKEKEKRDPERQRIHDLKREIADNIVADFVKGLESCDVEEPLTNKHGIAFTYRWEYCDNYMYHRIERNVPLADYHFMKEHGYRISQLVRVRLPDIRNHITGKPLWQVLMGTNGEDFGGREDTAILIAADFEAYKQHIKKKNRS